MKLPNKIFNRATKIKFNTEIYRSKKEGIFKIIGGRTRRKGKECILYAVPNRNIKELPNIKGIEREEMEKLWKFLKQKNVITTQDFKTLCPELYEEGSCCFAAFWGIINILFPDTFKKTQGKIVINFISEKN